MEYEIVGDNLQMVVTKVSSDEMVYGEAGAMVYMSDNVEMNAKAKGGFLKGLKRKFAGETFFLTVFTSSGDGFVAFAGNAPGRIKAIEPKGNEFLIHACGDFVEMNLAVGEVVKEDIKNLAAAIMPFMHK